MGQLWINTDFVQIKQARVFLLKLQRGLTPRFHLLQFTAQVLVLLIDTGVALKISRNIGKPRHRYHGPTHRWYKTVDHRDAQPFNTRAIDAPEQVHPK